MVAPGGVAVVFGQCAVGDDKQLHILEKAAPRPETLSSIAPNLVERLPDVHATSLELDVHQRQTVHQHGHVIAVLALAALRHILVDDLETVVVNVLLVNEPHIDGGAVVPRDGLDIILLNQRGLLLNAVVGVGDDAGEEMLPFPVAEAQVIQFLQLDAQVGDELPLALDGKILVGLRLELADERPLQLRLRLVAASPPTLHRDIFRDYRALRILADDAVLFHHPAPIRPPQTSATDPGNAHTADDAPPAPPATPSTGRSPMTQNGQVFQRSAPAPLTGGRGLGKLVMHSYLQIQNQIYWYVLCRNH